MLKPTSFAIAVLCLLALAAVGQQAPPPSGSQLNIDECEVALIDEAKVPAQEAGQITRLEAFEGLEVEEGTLLAQIDDSQAKSDKALAESEFEAAKIEAETDVEIQVGIMTSKVALAEYQQVKAANEIAQGAKSLAEVRVKEYTYKKALAQTDQARVNQTLAKAKAKAAGVKVSAADINIERRRVVAPISGKVVQLFLHRGEWANPGDPVLHLVRLDRLRVVGWVDVANYGPGDIAARPVELSVQLPGGRPATFQGKITFVDPLLARGGKKYRFYAEVVNRKENDEWLLQPGLHGRLAIDLTQRAPQREASKEGQPGSILGQIR